MSWDRLLGQELAKRILQNQIEAGQVSHAYLFTGPPATGKRQAAVILAQAVNCTQNPKPCGVCISCRQIETNAHPDVRYITPEGGSIKLQPIKDLLAEAVLTPNEGLYRVFIIESAETMTREAANALLLILEEPPHFDLFILTAAAPVIPTIESRCQVLRFQRRNMARSQAGYPPADTEGSDLGRNRAEQLVLDLAQAPLRDRSKLVAELEAEEIDWDRLLAELLSLSGILLFGRLPKILA